MVEPAVLAVHGAGAAAGRPGAPLKCGVTTVVVIEDHPLVRHGLVHVISEAASQLRLVGAYGSVEEFDGASPQADACVLGLHPPGLRGAMVVSHLRGNGWGVLVLAGFGGRPQMEEGLDAGASDYLDESAESSEIVRAIIDVATGRSRRRCLPARGASRLAETGRSEALLTRREGDVLKLVAVGATDKTIARELGLALTTVHSHLDRIRAKSGRRRRADLTRLALDLGLIGAARPRRDAVRPASTIR